MVEAKDKLFKGARAQETIQRIRNWRVALRKRIRYCRYKKPCTDKHIKKTYLQGTYMIRCEYYPQLCNQQTTQPQKLILK